MTGDLSVSRQEAGVTRVFAVNLPEEAVEHLAAGDGERLGAALGVDYLDHDFVELIRVADLQPIGLSGYLTEGFGAPAAQVAADRARLDALEGHVLLVSSQAFGGREADLAPAGELTLIGTYREAPAAPSFEPIHSDSATGTIAPPDLAAAPLPGRRFSAGWVVAIAVLVAALLVLVIT